jgi:hypothetical protein
MALTPEGKVKAKVKALLNKYKVYHFMPATGGYGRSGVPDIIACAHGRFIGIECKAQNGRLTALQSRELAKIEEAGGLSYCIDENSFESLEKIISDLTSSNKEE